MSASPICLCLEGTCEGCVCVYVMRVMRVSASPICLCLEGTCEGYVCVCDASDACDACDACVSFPYLFRFGGYL